MTTTPSVPDPVFQLQADGPLRAARSLSDAGPESLSSRTISAAACGLLLLIAGVGGGGRGGLGDTFAQLLAVLLLAWLCWLGARGRIAWQASPWVRFLPLLAVALPLLQLLPVPEVLWTLGAARTDLAAGLGLAGVPLPHRISLDPSATEAALWSLLPATALFLATLTLTRQGQRAMLVAIVFLALANVGLGMAQVSGGTESTLRLYAHTNADQAVGFFANRNHLACLLVMSLPIALAWTAWSVTCRLAGKPVSPIRILAGCTVVVILILGVALSRSRAGLLLGMLAVLGSLPMAVSIGAQRGTRRVLALTLAIAVMLTVQFSLIGVVHRIDSGSLDDGRWRYTTVTLAAARAYAPLGSGLGTFRQAYEPFEAKQGEPNRYIVNHAHDDYVELWLEGGVAALLLMLAGAFAWLRLGLASWRAKRERSGKEAVFPLATVCWWSATLGLLHSFLDYPLRTTANMSVFAVLAAISFAAAYRASSARR